MVDLDNTLWAGVTAEGAVQHNFRGQALLKRLKQAGILLVALSSDMERLLELIQRTNQFNTTTKRRPATEIQNLLTSNEYAVYVASLSDRFGKLGIVAVAIIDRRSGDEYVFDSFIMSCRAMGFGLELAFIRKILDIEPGKRYVGQYLPTERNGPAAQLFGNAGFEKTSDTEWVLESGSGGPSMPSWFENYLTRGPNEAAIAVRDHQASQQEQPPGVHA